MHQTIFAQIEPTTKCNFTCGFCCGRQMDQSDLSLEKFQKILDFFPEIQHLELQGEGEPLIHPDFFPMVERATEKQIQLSLITNGSLFSNSNIQRILTSRITSIRVSIETVNPDRFHEIRGGSLAIVEQGIQRLMAARKQQGTQYPSVGLAVTVLASTLADLPNIFEWYDRLNLDGGIAIQGLNKIPQYAQYYDDAMQQEYLVRERDEAEYQEYMSRAIVQKIWQTKSPYIHFYDQLFQPAPEEIAQGKRLACPWLESGIYVDRHSRVTPCCMVKGETWSFGYLENLDRDALLQERAQLSAQLKGGEIPTPCQGCHIATEIVT